MDFAALMSAQIAKAKTGSSNGAKTDGKNRDAAPATPKESSAATKKFINNSEAERLREAAYRADQERSAAEREAKLAAKRKREDEAVAEAKTREEKRQRLAEESRRRREERAAAEERARRKRLGLPELPPDGADGKGAQGSDPEDDEDAEAPGEEDLRARLRAFGQPVVLFGETRKARLRRLRLSADVPIPTTLPPVREEDMKLDGSVPDSKTGRRRLFRQLASYFNMVLAQWEATLHQEGMRPGSQEYSAMVQSRDTMKPLFRKLEKGELDDGVLQSIVEIIKAAQERRYVDANDGYLQVCIGRAPWPIGVTMVGIHERSAREKLHAGEKGHVMGDEVTRKYLQSIKRMLTYAQTRWPPHDIGQLMG